MKIKQYQVNLKPRSRGMHIITKEVVAAITELSDIKTGIAFLFLQHTSASLAINENADTSVLADSNNFFNKLCDNKNYYTHISEGPDDMPGHIKSMLMGINHSIPVTNGKLNLGIWQGIYLNEHRNNASGRKLIITLLYD